MAIRIDIEYNGIRYEGYNLITDRVPSQAFGSNYIRCGIYEYTVSTSMQVPKGSKINLMPNCPYPIEDIRKNYKIKRGTDTAEYNIYCPITWKQIRFYGMLICPAERTVYAASDRRNPEETIRRLYSSIPYHPSGQVISYQIRLGSTIFCWCAKVPDMYLKAIDGTLTKPLVSYTQLNVSSEADLTASTLILVARAAMAPYSEDNIHILQNELHALNNYNYRKYPATMHFLLGLFGKNGSTGNRLWTKLSTYTTKAITEILRYKTDPSVFLYTPETQEDYDLCKEFICEILNIHDTVFCSYSQFQNKLNENYMTVSELMPYIDVTCRLKLKDFN